MKYLPENDGIDHINVYSKGKTELGRLLSNFAHTPFTIQIKDEDFTFQSVEGYWYYLLTKDKYLCHLHGFKAKQYGKSKWNDKAEPVTEEQLATAYWQKLREHPKIWRLLRENTLPLAHYYVFSGKVIVPKEFQWTAELWNKIKHQKAILR
jgi:hypothetical protein